MNFYLKLRDLRKYFFLKVIVWLKFIRVLLYFVSLYPLLPDDIDYSTYAYNIVEYSFLLFILIFLCFLLFFIEAFISFVKRKYILKKEPEHIPFHKSQKLNILDNIYTAFFTAVLLYAVLTTFLFISLP